MRFLHTSDWHLGRIFHGLHLTEDQAYILRQFTDLVQDTKPDAVVIAGDVYDRAAPPVEAVKLLDEVLSRLLIDYRVPVIMIAGNHDSPERLGFGNRLLAQQNLHIFGRLVQPLQPVVLYDAFGPVYFSCIPFAEPALVRDLYGDGSPLDYDQAMGILVEHTLTSIPAGARKVAVAHAYVVGGESSESENPLSIGGSDMVKAEWFSLFQYTALGHLHRNQKIGAAVHYPGSLLKYSFGEANQSKRINLVEIDGQGNVVVEGIQLLPRREVRCIAGLFEDILKGFKTGENTDDYIQIELADSLPVVAAQARLQEVYPNLMSLKYGYENYEADLKGLTDVQYRTKSMEELFALFYEQMTDSSMNEQAKAEFAVALEEIQRDAREV